MEKLSIIDLVDIIEKLRKSRMQKKYMKNESELNIKYFLLK